MKQPLITAFILSGAVSASAGQLALQFDQAATRIQFELGATMHTVHGTIGLTGGEVTFDPDDGSASGELVIDARSADTDNEKRDRDMHGKVLESEQFPTIVLRPERVTGPLPSSGSGQMTLSGSIDLHGSQHAVEIPLQVKVDVERIEVHAEFEVPYVEWGLTDPSKFLLKVKKFVTVTVDTTATVGAIAEAPAAAADQDTATD